MNFLVQQFTIEILEFRRLLSSLIRFSVSITHEEVSVLNAKGPPVPIPNTEVKLCSAENTCLETDRKDRSTLTSYSCAG